MNNSSIGLLAEKTAVIYGGGGAIGGAVARVFAREGARVFLAGRTQSKLAAVARDIESAGGSAELAVLDVFDEGAVNAHAGAVAAMSGGIDIMLNAIGIAHVQGVPAARRHSGRRRTVRRARSVRGRGEAHRHPRPGDDRRTRPHRHLVRSPAAPGRGRRVRRLRRVRSRGRDDWRGCQPHLRFAR